MAGDYIRREAALEAFENADADVYEDYGDGTVDWGFGRKNIQNVINGIPAADVAEVVHGRWIDGAEDFTCGNHNAECSICRCYVSWDGCDEDFNYCPNCGAKMDGGFDDATS